MCIPSRARQPAAGLLLCIVAALAVACGPSSEVPPQRLVGAIPAEQFRFSEQSIDEVFRWDFDADADLEPWTLRADPGSGREGSWLRLRGSEANSLVRAVDLAATDIDRFLVRIDGLGQGSARVFWAAEGESFTTERRVVRLPAQGIDGVFEFRVGEHPEWKGQIRRLRFDTFDPDGDVAVASIVGARAGLDLPGEIYDREWALELDYERRAGLVVVPGEPQRRRLGVPRSSRLHFATALLKTPPSGAARFTVTRLEGEQRTEIFSEPIADPFAAPRLFQDHSVELEPGGEEEVELELALECPEVDDCAGTFASIELRPSEPPQRPNILLISIDTLRADRMSLYGNANPTTERIDRWAADHGVVFEQVVAPAPWTLPSHVSMFTGADPLQHDVNHHTTAPETLELLSERLHELGYFTAAVTGGAYVDPDFGFWQGFDVYRYWQRSAGAYRGGASDEPTELDSGMAHALELLDEIDDRPFFFFFHTYEVHAPFHAREPYFSRFYGQAPEHPQLRLLHPRIPQTADNGYKAAYRLHVEIPAGAASKPLGPEDLALAHAAYDSGIAYTDQQIGRLLDELEARGALENTIIVLTSDHGEMLGEEGLGGHGYLFEPNLRIPLVISWPARFAGGERIDSLVRTVDIAPTLLELLGQEVPDDIAGVSLVPQLEGREQRQPPEAVSYAASANRGVSLWFDNGLLYVYQNSPWRIGPLDRLAPADPDSPAASLDYSERAQELRPRIEQLLEDRDGLHMMLSNDEAAEQELVVRLRGTPVDREKLKATGVDCDCASWQEEEGVAELRVPPGHRFGLLFEDVIPGKLEVELRAGTDVYSTEVDLAELEQPVAADWLEGGWAEVPMTERLVERGFALWWQGDSGMGGNAPMDEGLRRRLRALGYLR